MEKRIRKMRIFLETVLFISLLWALIGVPIYAVYGTDPMEIYSN